MSAQLNANTAQDQQPQHDHQRQIKPAETRGVEKRKSEEKGPTAGQQPYFVAVPDRPHGADDGAPLLVSPSNQQVKNACAQIKTVKHHVPGDHDGDQPKPEENHDQSPSLVIESTPPTSAEAGRGPRAISCCTRVRNKIASRVYKPMNPRR